MVKQCALLNTRMHVVNKHTSVKEYYNNTPYMNILSRFSNTCVGCPNTRVLIVNCVLAIQCVHLQSKKAKRTLHITSYKRKCRVIIQV